MKNLIDADALKKKITNYYTKQDMIDAIEFSVKIPQITVEHQEAIKAILDKLEAERNTSFADWEYYCEKHNLTASVDDYFYKGLQMAIDIIKKEVDAGVYGN